MYITSALSAGRNYYATAPPGVHNIDFDCYVVLNKTNELKVKTKS